MLLRWFINALALILVSYVLPGFHVNSLYSALIVALILGLINVTIRPVLLLLTLPINIMTLGLFTFVINGFSIWLVSTIVKGFTIDSFAVAVWGALILWAVSLAVDRLMVANHPLH